MANGTTPFNPDKDIPSLGGKVILITGANTGLGKRSALELAKHNPAALWVTARSTEKANAAVEEVKKQSPNASIKPLELDLTSFKSIKSAAKKFQDSSSRLDVLMLNAGILGAKPSLTEDGYEIHIGTNHVGHALLLKLLTPLLTKTASGSSAKDVRAIILTSIGWKFNVDQGLEIDTFKSVEGAGPVMRYVQSKLANMLYAQEMAKHYPQFTTVSVHPGEVDTELFSREPGDEQVAYLQKNVAPARVKPIDDGVKNQLWAASTSDLVSGEYYEPVGVLGLDKPLENAGGMAKTPYTASDKDKRMHAELSAKLWDWTEKELQEHDA